MDNELDLTSETAPSATVPGTSGVTRSQNQLQVLPEDARSAGEVLRPLLERLDTNADGVQLLALTSDSEAAAAIASDIAPAAGAAGLRVLAATESRRATRVLRATPIQVVVGSPVVVSELLRAATLKLDAVRVVVLAWVETLAPAAARALETVMAEPPKDSARVVLTADGGADAEQLVERYARRARRPQQAGDDAAAVSLSFVTAGESNRMAALRRLLDALDPENAYIVSADPASRTELQNVLRSLGYAEDSALVRVGEAPDGDAKVIILFDLPSSASALRSLVRAHAAARVIALATARQIAGLRRLAGGAVTPFVLPEAAVRARAREEAMRDELRATLATGQISRELLALEPLLSDHDAAEVAAAALRLLEAERARAVSAGATPAAAPAMTRIYFNIGETDGARPGDLVGAITNEAGISRAELGRVDVRDRHTTVEVATSVANTVVAKMTGTSIKQRRVIAKIDEGPERGGRPRRDDAPRRGGPPRRREDVRKR